MSDRQVILEINEQAFKQNVQEIQKIAGKETQIMPVIKANAYGTYINKNLDLIKDFKIVAVAIVSEAIELRKIGYQNDIMVLNQPYVEDIDNIIKYNVTVGVASKEFIKCLGNREEDVKIHLEIETGMGRTGIQEKDIEDIIQVIKKSKNINVEGIYTHFAVADTDEEFTKRQIEIFERCVQKIKSKIDKVKYIHHSASNGILNFPSKLCNLIRPGIIMYGYPSANFTKEKINLKPVAKLKAKISFIKELEKGNSISYGRTFITDKKMKIATVGIGYADGIRRCLSNNMQVVINGQKANCVGTICMDSFMVDVTNIKDVKIGDDAFIWDNENITLEEVAKKCGTINYEILSTISSRVPREFVN